MVRYAVHCYLQPVRCTGLHNLPSSTLVSEVMVTIIVVLVQRQLVSASPRRATMERMGFENSHSSVGSAITAFSL